jgi:hypothetical protein
MAKNKNVKVSASFYKKRGNKKYYRLYAGKKDIGSATKTLKNGRWKWD